MSTKVYEGFILADKWNDGKIETFEKFCNEIKLIVAKIYNKEYCLANKKYQMIYDLSKLFGKQTNIKDPYQVCREFTPIPDIAFFFFEGKIYGETFNDNYGIRKTLIEKGYIKDFAYWDNTDPDEEVSEEEWEERERVWDSIDHWQVSIQWQDYLMRSGFYLDQEEINALKEKKKAIKETTLKKWLRTELHDQIALDTMYKNDIKKTPDNILMTHTEVESLVDEVLKDEYKGEYLHLKLNLLKVIEDYEAEYGNTK